MAQQINTQIVAQNMAEAPSFWDEWKWYIIGGIAFLMIVTLTAWIIYKLIMGIKFRKDATYEKRKNWISIARRQCSRFYYSSFFKPEKNAPIFYYSFQDDKRINVSKFAHYYGHALLDDGFMIILFSNRCIHWLLWFIPKVECIFIPYTDKVEFLKKYDVKKKDREFGEIKNIPTHLESFTEEGIFIMCFGFNEEDGIYKPILKDKKGNLINYNIAIYQQIEGAVLKEVQYENLNAFVDNAKRSMAMNTDLNKTVKIKDATGSADD